MSASARIGQGRGDAAAVDQGGARRARRAPRARRGSRDPWPMPPNPRGGNTCCLRGSPSLVAGAVSRSSPVGRSGSNWTAAYVDTRALQFGVQESPSRRRRGGPPRHRDAHARPAPRPRWPRLPPACRPAAPVPSPHWAGTGRSTSDSPRQATRRASCGPDADTAWSSSGRCTQSTSCLSRPGPPLVVRRPISRRDALTPPRPDARTVRTKTQLPLHQTQSAVSRPLAPTSF